MSVVLESAALTSITASPWSNIEGLTDFPYYLLENCFSSLVLLDLSLSLRHEAKRLKPSNQH